jgi:hypothetical protein
MDRLHDPKWIVVQRKSTVHSELLHEGESVKGEAQWWISRAFWPRQDICKAKRSILLARNVVGSQEVCQQM